MGVIDPNLLDLRFKVAETKDTGNAILKGFENAFARYLVIGDHWEPGEYGLLLSRTRFVGDLVDLVADIDRKRREHWERLLTNSPGLLSTFIAGAVLKKLPSFEWDATRLDIAPNVENQIRNFLADYVDSWPRQNELRAEVVDVQKLDRTRLQSNAIAIANSRVVGILDLFETPPIEKSRGLVIPAAHAAAPPPAETVQPKSITPAPAASVAFVAHPRIGIRAHAVRGEALPFTVGFCDRPDSDADEQKRIKIDDATPGETVLVIASAEGARIDEPSFAELALDLAAEHEFTARVSPDATAVSLRANYLFRHKPVGHIVKSVPIDGARPTSPDTTTAVSPAGFKPDFVRSLGKDAAIDDLDLILFVEKGEPGQVSWRTYEPLTGAMHGPYAARLDDPERFAKDLASLRGKHGDSGPSATDELRVTGQQIADCIPPRIKDALVPVLARGRPPAILIMTDHAFVPWELARFKFDGINGNQPAFLGELARIGRWWTAASLSGPQSSRSIETISAVAATEYGLNTTVQTLEHAKAERDWLSTHYWAKPVEARRPDIDDWLDTMPRPKGHLGHIALHGFSDSIADSQGLILADGKVLTPNRLAGEYYEGDIPRFEMLFLNACQVGTAGERLGRIAGFPGAILRGGAVAFIGPLWEVQDSVAHAVAEQFYERVLGSNEEIGEALRQLRTSAPMRNSITPWAYLFYGHPRLRLTHSH